ncbi:MAG: hypothetical protein IH851_06635 [Armatimonadetes bacterium]|nr:hypothetical protein [Armatimonadota bacterium]
MRLVAIALVALTAAGAAAQRPARPQAEALQHLKRVIDAQAHLHFAGTRTVEIIVNGERVRITEFVKRDGLRSRTDYPKDSFRRGFIVVERAGERLEYVPGLNEIRKGRGGRERTTVNLGRLREAIVQGRARLVSFDGGVVAGRHAVGVAVSDARGNVAQRLWIDSEKGLVLKAVQYGRGGSVLGGFEFTRVDYKPRPFPKGTFEIRRIGARVVNVQPPRVNWRVLRPAWMPNGLRQAGEYLRRLDRREVFLTHFTDGHRHLTIFQSPGPPIRIPHPADPDIKVQTLRRRNMWLVAIGNLEPATLRRVLESLR